MKNFDKFNIKKPKAKKKLIIISICTVFLIAILLFIGKDNFLPRGEGNVIYEKGNTIYVANLLNGSKTELFVAEDKPLELTSDKMMERYLNALYVSPQGNVVYSNAADNKKDGFDIYLKNEKGEKILIDSDVREYTASKDACNIVYIKGDENTLYLNSMGEKKHLANDVFTASLSEDGKKGIYYTYSGDIYVWSENNSPKLIASGVTMELLTENADVVYYLKNGELFKWSFEKGAEFIKDGVFKLVCASKEKGICYITKRKEVLSYYDLILKDNDTLSKLSEEYVNKLKENKIELTYYNLYYNFENEEILISDNYFYQYHSSGRKQGDYIRKETDFLNYQYKKAKEYRDNVYVEDGASLEYIDGKVKYSFGSTEIFMNDIPHNYNGEIKITKDSVTLPDGSEYYLELDRGIDNNGYYRNLYYRKDGISELMDTMVGFVSATDSGEVWILKGREGEAWDLFSYSDGKRRYLEKGINSISQVSGKRKREFYEFVKGYGGRISEIITDEGEYQDTIIDLNLPEGTGLI